MIIITSHEFVTHRVANSMSHQDSGQMDRYVWMSDTPTFDPILLLKITLQIEDIRYYMNKNRSLHRGISCIFNLKNWG